MKSLVLNCFLFISAGVAHIFAGGSFDFSSQFLLVTFISILFFVNFPLSEMQGPKFAATLVIFQFLGHLTLPVHHSINETQMSFSHLIAFFLTYWISKNYELVINRALDVLGLIIYIPQLFQFKLRSFQQSSFFEKQNTLQRKYFLKPLLGRAPPAF